MRPAWYEPARSEGRRQACAVVAPNFIFAASFINLVVVTTKSFAILIEGVSIG